MTTTNAFTVLAITGVGVQPYSCRGAKQELSNIDQAAQLRRDVNGNLTDISFSGFKKFKSTISCSDMVAPSFDGKWPGLQVVVDCISELSFVTATETQQRPEVPGSMRIDGDFTIYRPRLTMRIMAMSTSTDEYDANCDWSIDLEEV
jgi:hypothetical protein